MIMKNLNYPTWESGIPQMMPEVNPYNDEYYYIKVLNTGKIEVWNHYEIEKWYKPQLYQRVEKNSEYAYAWGYMEILQWLRDKGYHIKILWGFNGDYYFMSIDTLIDGKLRMVNNINTMNRYPDYYEALDEAIIYTLNLLKDEM